MDTDRDRNQDQESYALPAHRSEEGAIRADLRRAQSPEHNGNFNTPEETETGRALAEWFVSMLDVERAAGLLPPVQRAIMRLLFLEDHRCEGSGLRVVEPTPGMVVAGYPCPSCYEVDKRTRERRPMTVRVDGRGRLAAHNRPVGNADVARLLGLPVKRVQEERQAAIEALRAYKYGAAPADARACED